MSFSTPDFLLSWDLSLKSKQVETAVYSLRSATVGSSDMALRTGA
jgi:hypothetical protein